MRAGKSIFEEKGVTAIMAALLLTVLLSTTALVVDIGFGVVAKNQLHNIADGGSLAGTRQLGVIYENLPLEQQQNYVLTSDDRTAIINQVLSVGSQNAAAGKSISIEAADIRIGQWDSQTNTLTETNVQPDAVEVTARRDGTANGPITTFFAGLMGHDTLNVTSSSWRNNRQERPTAALTPVGLPPEGALDIPVGISTAWFDGYGGQEAFCDQPIQFSPTNSPEGCAGWHTFHDNSNANNLRNIIDGLNDGSYTSPGATAGETSFEFIGGDVASAFDNFQALFEAKAKCLSDPTLPPPCNAATCPSADPDDLDGSDCKWDTFVVVYDYDNCSNPQGDIQIVGFATTEIYEVVGPPDKTIVAQVKCDAYEPDARGGGGEFGTKGTIPGLVQ